MFALRRITILLRLKKVFENIFELCSNIKISVVRASISRVIRVVRIFRVLVFNDNFQLDNGNNHLLNNTMILYGHTRAKLISCVCSLLGDIETTFLLIFIFYTSLNYTFYYIIIILIVWHTVNIISRTVTEHV